jgi:glycosyltransferase 2 family protein
LLRPPEHDPEKWMPVFGKKSCSANRVEQGDANKAPLGLAQRVRALQAQISFTPRALNRFGLALSATIILTSAVVLFYRLRGLDWGSVQASMAGVPFAHVAAAAFFAACGYVTLAAYDWFALRTIGARQVPLSVAALTGVTSYAIGHGIGAMVVASAAIRLRIYSRWGLGIIDIAKMSFIAGLTFWLGNITALGAAMVFMPAAAGAVDQIPSWGNRAIGVAVLGTLITYLVWVWSKTRMLGRNGAGVTLPSGAMTLLQIGIGLTDLTCASLVMYLLMPSLPAVDFLPLAVIVVFGTLVGFASHAPGALGALDAAMLIGLPAFDRADLVATLLIYRLLFFVIPFALALVGLGLREAYVHFHE